MKAAQTPREMVSALECALVTSNMGRGKKRSHFHHKPHQHYSPSLGTPQGALENCLPQPLPQDEPMPTEPEHRPASMPFKPWLVGHALHVALQQ